MRNGMRTPGDGDIQLRCPLFLLSGETAGELDALLRDLRGARYTPLSLRELFRCRRGLRPWPPRPCGVLLREVPFPTLLGILPLLDRWETPAALFCRTPYGEAEREELRACRWLYLYGDADASDGFVSLPPEGTEGHLAAFCGEVDARASAFLRENRIWMAVTTSLTVGDVPGVTDLLYALPVGPGDRLPELLARWHRALTPPEEPREAPRRGEALSHSGAASYTVVLPLEIRPPVTDPPAAVYLSILGDTPEHLSQVLAATDWAPAFDPSDGSYRLCPSRKALAEEALTGETLTAEPPSELLRALREGSYPFLRPRADTSEGVLLFGYDGGRDVFLGMASFRSVGYERVFLSPRALESYPAACRFRLTPDRSLLAVSAEEAMAWAAAALEDPSAAEGVLYGWGASVAFVNRVTAGDPVPAASLRAFLQERQLNALRLLHLCRRERLHAEAAERLLALFEEEGRPVLRAEGELPSQGILLQRLLNAEGLCRRTFAESLARMQTLRAFRAEKNGKKE